MMRSLLAITLCLMGCSGPGETLKRQARTKNRMCPHASNTVIQQRGPGEWTVAVTCSMDELSQTGEFVALARPRINAPEHVELAAARAWRAMANARIQKRDYKRAILAARAGIDALGRKYRPRRIKDDTGLNILVAEEAISQGKTAGGTRQLIQMLDTRLSLYATKFAAAVR